ncbi:MAG: hypothetical protein KJP21_03290, partial [Bacteroidia bacterium]|nr:hypothetical protein [Bacteroidia bacterium]
MKLIEVLLFIITTVSTINERHNLKALKGYFCSTKFMRLSLILIFALSLQLAYGQTSNSYADAAGNDYWKNRKPEASYWQQDVHYKIEAIIDEKEELIQGKETLVYFNNSPDTLDKVYFHLYQNAFTPESYAHNLRKTGKIATKFGENEEKGDGTILHKILIDGENVLYNLDNTILKIELPNQLLPNGSIKFDIDFTTFWDKQDGGNMRRRMKTFTHNGVTQFDGVHWYPRICVYDRKFGWTTDQH